MQVAIWKVAKSGTRVSLVLFILQEVGRLVSFHPSAVDYLEGRVSTGVVHAAQWSVPAGGQGDLRPGIMVDGSCDAVQSQIQEEKKRSKRKCVSKMRLTLCHREYSRARTASSGMTRCRDRSSPMECKKASNSIFVYSWHWFHSQKKNAKKQNKKHADVNVHAQICTEPNNKH